MGCIFALFAASASVATAPLDVPRLGYDPGILLLADITVARPAEVPLERAAEPVQAGASWLDGEGGGGITISPSITLVSNYHDRGFSLSNRRPAIQGGIDVEAGGFYAGAWASTIARFADSKIELSVFGGWAGAVAGFDLDGGVNTTFYPGGDGTKFAELYGSVGKGIGPVAVTVGASYAPSQKHNGGDNLYAYSKIRTHIPKTPLTLVGLIGYENGSFAGDTGEKIDWSLGAEAALKGFVLGVRYVDSDVKKADDPDRNARPSVVASLGWSF